MILTCTVLGRLHLLGSLAVPIIIGLGPIASGGAIVNCLFLVDACSGFCTLGLPRTVCPLSLADLGNMLTEGTGCVSIAVVMQLQMNCTWYMSVQLYSRLGSGMRLYLPMTLTL